MLPFAACDCGGSELLDTSPKLTIDTLEVDFGEVPVGGLRIRGVKMRNDGGSSVFFERFELESPTGEIALATPALTELRAGQELDFNFVYEPGDAGEDRGTLSIVANVEVPNRTINLVGVGVEAGVGVTHDGQACGDAENSIDFGGAVPGQTVEHIITVTSSGRSPVTVLSAVAEPGSSPEFTIDNVAMPTALSAGETLQLNARYAPVDGGPDTGAFVITTDAPNMPSIRISVCGLGTAPAVCARPNPLNLGPVGVGQNASGTMTLESCGTEPVTISEVALSDMAPQASAPGYTLTPVGGLPVTLNPGETLEAEVGFSPASLGQSDGWVRVASDALNNETAFFPVIARGAEPCGLEAVPMSVSYANVMPGATEDKNVLVFNTGASQCEVTRLEITTGAGLFSLQNAPALPASIGPGGQLVIPVRYSPTAAGMPDMGALEIEEGGVVQTVELVGNPDVTQGCHVQVDPSFLNFGGVPPGTTRSLGMNVTNISDDTCVLTGVDLLPGTDARFIETSQNFGLIFAGRSKTLSVTYNADPAQSGPATGTAQITFRDGAPVDVPLFATTAASNICVDPLHVAFGQTLGSEESDFRIYACGTLDVTVTALDWTQPNAEFTLVNPPAMPFTLTPGSDQVVTVRYVPTDNMGDTGVITVRSDDIAEPAIDVTVTGGPEIVPPSAGRYLYYWQIPNPLTSDIMELPLQGNTTTRPFYGSSNGNACSGCHSVSPDGRYVALVEGGSGKIIDTRTGVPLSLPNSLQSTAFISWKPDVNTTPPYQYAYDNGQDIQIAALFDGRLRTLQGADDNTLIELMPSWGSNGQIAFARGMMAAQGQNGAIGFAGAADILVVPEAGGAPVPLMGASNNGGANYYPVFSPNGNFIALTYSAQAMSTIAASDAVIKLVASDNSGWVSNLPNANHMPGDGASSYPTWAVDGSHLSFASNRSGGAGDWDIYIAPIDPMTGADGAATNLLSANSPGFEHGAQWSP